MGIGILGAAAIVAATIAVLPAATNKPPLHARKWLAITGKPLAATAGAMIFQKGGNAVDAACAMIAATCTMWDTLSWGGETQALIYNPHTRKVIGVNALGVAPTGATPDFFRGKGMEYPPEYGPLAAVTPGTPGGIMVMLAEYGKLSLADVLAPAIEMADGYPIEQQLIGTINRRREWLLKWPESRRILLPRPGDQPPAAGEIFKQPDLAATLRKLVETEKQALAAGKSRKDAILAANDRFYRGDIARELVRGAQEVGGLFTAEDLANWKVRIEEPVRTTYKGIDVYKLDFWTQGPAMLQALNILENVDVKAMGYNSARYIHALYQVMNLAFADRDFYYGDTDFPPEEPRRGLLSKEYAKARAAKIDWTRNDPTAKPGDPYPFQGQKNPYADLLAKWPPPAKPTSGGSGPDAVNRVPDFAEGFYAGTTSVEAADAEGWVVSVTPVGRLGSGGHRRKDRDRHEPAHAELRRGPQREPLQRARARQAPARDAHTDARVEGRQAVPLLLRTGRRLPGPEPAAVLPERRRVRHDRAGGDRGRKHQQLPDAQLVRRPRVAARSDDDPPHASAVGEIRADPDGLHARSRAPRPPARSTPSFSTASTARCGAGPPTTARTTESAGERAASR